MLDAILDYVKKLGTKVDEAGGSFRGVPFLIIDDATLRGGHRVVRHEYPLRDVGDSENMGRKMLSWSINAVVIGKDYATQKNALIDALNDAEPAEMVHPYYGTEFVQIEEWTCTESTSGGGVAFFAISYTEAVKEESPAVADNGEAILAEEKDGFFDNLIDDFSAAWETVQATQAQIEAAMTFAETAINNVTGIIRGLSSASGLSGLLGGVLGLKGSIKNLINAPRALANDIKGLLSGFKSIAKKSDAQNGLHKTITGITATPKSDDKITRELQSTIETLIIGIATAELAELALSDARDVIREPQPTVNDSVNNSKNPVVNNDVSLTETLTDCENVTNLISNDLIDVLIATGDVYWYGASSGARNLRQTFVEQMQSISSALPSGRQIALQATEPALVALYRETGDCKTVSRFCRRNGVRHPSFVAGGKSYEVID